MAGDRTATALQGRSLPSLNALILYALLLTAGLVAEMLTILLAALLWLALLLVELDRLAALGVLVLVFVVRHVDALLTPRAGRVCLEKEQGSYHRRIATARYAGPRRLARTIAAFRVRPSRRARLSGEPRNRSRNSSSVIASSTSGGGGGVAGTVSRASGA